MSPVNLGQLPNNQPAPLGRWQRKDGAANVAPTWNNGVSYRALDDGVGGQMRVDCTPTTRTWWLVHANTMWIVPAAAWVSWEWGLDLYPNGDLNGFWRAKVQMTQHSATSWNSASCSALYLLEANVSYTCYAVWHPLQANGVQYHCHPYYHWLEGEYVGEGGV